MTDLRITGVTANHLELEGEDGSKHTLEITEDFLKALRSRKPIASGQALTPREIQEQIRLGSTIEQLLVINPADEDAIRKFGAPIISELNHIVSLARNVRLNLATDRFADPAHIEFGLVMDDRLRANSANTLYWSSRKSVDGQWLVTVNFQVSQTPGFATWSFNPKLLLLTPENQTAIQLSNGMTLNLTKNAEVSATPKSEITNTFVHPVNQEVDPIAITSGLTIVPELVEEVKTEVLNFQDETPVRPTLRVAPEEPESIFESTYLDEPLGTIDEVALDDEVFDIEEPLLEETIEEVTNSDQAISPPAATTSRWAEVLFGSKPEDEELS
jgi:hypothetical protein